MQMISLILGGETLNNLWKLSEKLEKQTHKVNGSGRARRAMHLGMLL